MSIAERALGVCLVGLVSVTAACHGPSWRSNLLANPRQVAQALNDPVELGKAEAFDPTALPSFDPPAKVRPCCVFGMDMEVAVGAARVPGYKKSNILSIDEIQHHGYDDGNIASDKNGLVYTCRGGFIDTAHIRDNADLTIYLATQLLRALPQGTTIDLPAQGTKRRIIVKPLPKELVTRYERFRTAAAIAGWIEFQLSVWHEIVTWYGWESIKGFSEKISAFSPEDLYSNVLGISIARGIIQNRELRSRAEYDDAMDAWIREALRRLSVVRKPEARQAMQAVDGFWWDSKKAIPDWKLVTRRYFHITSPLAPWIVKGAPENSSLRKTCDREPPPLELQIPERIGEKRIEDFVSIEFEFDGWNPNPFPLPAEKGKTVTVADFPKIIDDIRRQAAAELGPNYDHPDRP